MEYRFKMHVLPMLLNYMLFDTAYCIIIALISVLTLNSVPMETFLMGLRQLLETFAETLTMILSPGATRQTLTQDGNFAMYQCVISLDMT